MSTPPIDYSTLNIRYPTNFGAKRKARRFTVQGLYEWAMTQNLVYEIEARTRSTNAMHKVDVQYYHVLLSGVVTHAESLDALLTPLLDRKLTELDGIELAVLRLGAYELVYCTEVPFRVVLDESIELAKHFGATDSHKFVNGVLNQLAVTTRAVEVASLSQSHTDEL